MFAEDALRKVLSKLKLKHVNIILVSNQEEIGSTKQDADNRVLDSAYDYGIKCFVGLLTDHEVSSLLINLGSIGTGARLITNDRMYEQFEEIGLDEFFHKVNADYLQVFANRLNVSTKSKDLKADLAEFIMFLGSRIILERVSLPNLKEIASSMSIMTDGEKLKDISIDILATSFKGAQKLQKARLKRSKSTPLKESESKRLISNKASQIVKNESSKSSVSHSENDATGSKSKRRKNSAKVGKQLKIENSEMKHLGDTENSTLKRHSEKKSRSPRNLENITKKPKNVKAEQANVQQKARKSSVKEAKGISAPSSGTTASNVNEKAILYPTKEQILEMRKNFPIQKGISKQQLHDYYWLNELKDYCKQNTIPSHGKKSDIMQRIIRFLESGEVGTKKRKRKNENGISKRKRSEEVKLVDGVLQ